MTNLQNVVLWFHEEVDKIELHARSPRHERLTHVENAPCNYLPMEDGCIVSLWDAWSRFIRSLILSSATSKAIGLSGVEYFPRTPRSGPEAIAHLRANARGGGYSMAPGSQGEPKWYLPGDVRAICEMLDLENSSIIGDAVVSNVNTDSGYLIANPIASIQQVRNYVAHKSVYNLDRVRRRFQAGPSCTISDIIWSRTPGGSDYFGDWVDALKGISESAAL